MSSSKPSALRGLIVGVTAGIAATIVMDQFQKLVAAGHDLVDKKIKQAEGESAWAIAHEHAEQHYQQQHAEASTEKVARKLAEAVGTTLPPDKRKQAGQAVHYAFGTLMGAFYGVAAELVPETTTGGGTAFGTLLFLGADEVAVPAFKLAPPPKLSQAPDHLQYWAAHIVYGGSLELFRSLLRRAL